MQINTVNEQDAYDKGFADGKDYWMPLEQDRLLQLLQDRLNSARQVDDATILTAMQVPVDKECAIATTESLIWAIQDNIKKEENNV